MSEYFIGLMSGTSLDGIDAVLADFSNDTIQIIGHYSSRYSNDLRSQLSHLSTGCPNELLQLAILDSQLGYAYSQAVRCLLNETNLQASNISAIGCHGQTIRHYPDKEIANSIQIGNPNIVSTQTKITTIADFRRKDISVGGQGAPLVPAFHQAYFSAVDINRTIVNIGGMANITILPTQTGAPVLGFDTGPGNRLLDDWINQIKSLNFDENGQWAASGKVNSALLEAMMKDEYFHRQPPKSTGREYFNKPWINKYLQKIGTNVSHSDIQMTLTTLTAKTISAAIKKYAPSNTAVYVCGGGALNATLLSILSDEFSHTDAQSTDMLGIPPQLVEATAFAWMAKQTLDGKTLNLSSTTGATKDVILGGIYPA